MNPQVQPPFSGPLLPSSFLQKYSVQRPDVIVDLLLGLLKANQLAPNREGRRGLGEVQFLRESSRDDEMRSDRTSIRSISFSGYLVGSWLHLHLPISCFLSTLQWTRGCLYLWGALECGCGMAKEGGAGVESIHHKTGKCDKMTNRHQWLRDPSIGAWLSSHSHSHSLFKLWQSVLGPDWWVPWERPV